MIYRELPGTGFKISALAFGAWAIGGWLWGGTDRKAAVKAIHSAIDNGMTTIDTAAVYGFGLSEELIGEAIRGKRSQVQIFTKFGLRWNNNYGYLHYKKTTLPGGKEGPIFRDARKESVIRECEDSLMRLGVEVIDLYQNHWPDPTTPVAETFEAIERLKEQGKIRFAGVSNYSAEQFIKVNELSFVPVNQVPYSMVLRNIEEELVPWCLENNRGVIAYSPMQRGLLTGKIVPGQNFSDDDHRNKNPFFKSDVVVKVNSFLKKIEPVAHDNGLTLPQVVLNWTLHRPAISCVLAGARNPEQVLENVKAADASIPESDMKFINAELDRLELNMDRLR